MNRERQQALWEAINRYAASCGGGGPSRHVYGNTLRQRAVADIEKIIGEIEQEAWAGGFRDSKHGANR